MSFTMHKPVRKHNAERSAPPWLDHISPDAPPIARKIVNSIIGIALRGKKSERIEQVEKAAVLAGKFVVGAITVLDTEAMRLKDKSASRLTPIIRAHASNVSIPFDKKTLHAIAAEPLLDEAAIREGFNELKEHPDDLSSVSVALTEALRHRGAPFHGHLMLVIDVRCDIHKALLEHQPENPVLN